MTGIYAHERGSNSLARYCSFAVDGFYVALFAQCGVLHQDFSEWDEMIDCLGANHRRKG